MQVPKELEQALSAARASADETQDPGSGVYRLVAAVYREVSALLADAGLDHEGAAAGCARCQACSGLSAWERVFEKERRRGLAVDRAS